MKTAGKQRPANSIYFASVVIGMAQTVVFAVMPMLGREMGLNKLVLSIPALNIEFALKEMGITSIVALASIAFFLTTPIWGRYSDRVGRKRAIIIGLVGYTLGTFIFNGVAYSGLAGIFSGWTLYLLLIFSRLLVVGMLSASSPSLSAYIVDVTAPEQRTKYLGRQSAAFQMGMMFGPVLAFFAFVSLITPLNLQAVLTGLTALAIWKWLPDNHTPQPKIHASARLRYFDPRVRHYFGMSLLITIMMALTQQTLGFYFQDNLGLDTVTTTQKLSLAMVVSSATMLATQLLVVQHWKKHPFGLLKIGLLLVFASHFCLAMSTTLPTLLASIALNSLGMAMANPGIYVSATFTLPGKEQGSLAGLMASISGLGFIIGPILGGLLYGYSHALTYWFAGSVLFLLWLWVLFFKPTDMHLHADKA